ncbi:AEC family transporter [Lutimaribacter sp. EGI FJ00015]|uniref:AEC family transporter n=1 Tax=Lutimaribacter degradans TaxID=2945989 RepID=A0ACC5ZU51_9RHOB|nr:AEC family transporter [Lutimaribacter sp. EGI FJ00013]MCM2561715.1 AEC family transporter [Lutimaribacter sp. EGI FJ00013]MCO0612572.1 AEC family transporter [Lutimaribacter sp. EGI FJ00015]MCO0635231.1 AEC family transporter [Lutimaribacter sp. EGI FJ00014]
MQALLDIILPVFALIGFGYVAVWRGLFRESAVDGLMVFTQNFAIPALLFRAISTLDLGQNFDLSLLVSFYAGSSTGFFVGLLGGRYLFKRDWEDAVAIGFTCLFANSLMLGLAMTERAYGADALQANYAIVAVHSPFCYGLGITAMEIARARGTPARAVPGKVLRAMFRNALVIGIMLGFAVNLTGATVPGMIEGAVDMLVRAAIPCALFGMGGVLYRYRPDGDFRIIAYVCVVSLLLHPSITWTLGTLNKLSVDAMRSAVLTAAMAPGINAYVFANMYGRAQRVAASSVLIATALSIGTIWGWLHLLP